MLDNLLTRNKIPLTIFDRSKAADVGGAVDGDAAGADADMNVEEELGGDDSGDANAVMDAEELMAFVALLGIYLLYVPHFEKGSSHAKDQWFTSHAISPACCKFVRRDENYKFNWYVEIISHLAGLLVTVSQCL